MTDKIRRTEIQIETHEVKIVRSNSGRTEIVFCDMCGELTEHFSLVRAAVALGTSEVAAFRLLETGKFHHTEGSQGHLLICRNSVY